MVATFSATAEAIWFVGAKAVFVDIEPAHATFNVSKIEAAITPMTKAIIPVHLHGQLVDTPAGHRPPPQPVRDRRLCAGHRRPRRWFCDRRSTATPPRQVHFEQKIGAPTVMAGASSPSRRYRAPHPRVAQPRSNMLLASQHGYNKPPDDFCTRGLSTSSSRRSPSGATAAARSLPCSTGRGLKETSFKLPYAKPATAMWYHYT